MFSRLQQGFSALTNAITSTDVIDLQGQSLQELMSGVLQPCCFNRSATCAKDGCLEDRPKCPWCIENQHQKYPANLSIFCGHMRTISNPMPLHRMFERAVNAAPDQAHVRCAFWESQHVSYAEINHSANQLARVISQQLGRRLLDHPQGGMRCHVIALDIQPCVDLLVALLAAVKLGAAYLPVDSRSAINRVRYIMNECSPICTLVDAQSVFKHETDMLWSRYNVMDISELLALARASAKANNDLHQSESPERGLSQPLAVIYTSGSTGLPKGVVLTHRNALNRLAWQWNTFPWEEMSVGCFKTSLLFVDSIVEIFSCLLHLVPLVVVPAQVKSNPKRFVSLLEGHRVTRLVLVASMLRNILLYLSVSGGSIRLPHLSLWICNSETMTPALAHHFFDIFPNDKILCNFYGSTETTADVTYEMFRHHGDVEMKAVEDQLSVGGPMSNSMVYVVDEDLQILPKGDCGEICVSGDNVAQGYVGGTSDSNQCFIPNPFSSEPSQCTLYRTGDFGRMVNQMLIYEGRRDLQVKIRGQRVNISEIEKVVQEVPGVQRTVVLCHRFSDVSKVIVAYFTTETSLRQQQHHVEWSVEKACGRSLPAYMRPKLLRISELPLQPHSDKVDQVKLKRLYEKVFNRQSSLELSLLDEKCRKTLNILALNLNLPTSAISRRRSFFELGGNSISMISAIVQLEQHGLHIPIELFSSAQTVQDIIDGVSESWQQPMGRVLSTEQYLVRRLHQVPNNCEIVDILAESFIEKEPLDVLLGVTKTEILPFALSLYEEAIKYDFSLIVLDKDSGEIVGGDFLFEYSCGVRIKHHPSMAPILQLLSQLETPTKRRLMEKNPGRLLYNFCLCVLKTLPPAEQVKICHLIEGSVLQVARENGFIGVLTNNTNPVTQVTPTTPTQLLR